MEPITITLYVLGALVGLGALYFGISKLMGGSNDIGGEGLEGRSAESSDSLAGGEVFSEPTAELSFAEKYNRAYKIYVDTNDDEDFLDFCEKQGVLIGEFLNLNPDNPEDDQPSAEVKALVDEILEFGESQEQGQTPEL